VTLQATDPETEVFLQMRPRLFAAAYRMLGSVSDAEDILQEAYLRWQRADRSLVQEPAGYLIRITTRLCLDQIKSARVRRETYPGEWLPEPVLTEDPTALLDQDVTVALLLALERLSPLERAAFLLHDIFDGAYADIAATLNRSPEACRQLAARARRKVQQLSPKAPEPSQHGMVLAEAFFRASKTGDTAALSQLLARMAEARLPPRSIRSTGWTGWRGCWTGWRAKPGADCRPTGGFAGSTDCQPCCPGQRTECLKRRRLKSRTAGSRASM
jgi:RNA polymerase sigma factor (sigma-70 family)